MISCEIIKSLITFLGSDAIDTNPTTSADEPATSNHNRMVLRYQDGKIAYVGKLLHGMKHGSGTMFYMNGNKAYKGQFSNDLMHGNGKMYYKNSPNKLLFEGSFANGAIKEGLTYALNGTTVAKKGIN